MCGLVGLLLGVAASAAWAETAAPATPDDRYQFDATRVVAVGDVHGAFDALQGVLRANGLIDESNHWSGGTTHLVSLGDLLDRGARSRAVMDLFRALQPQARAAGGRVHVLLGNHETMNLLGDLRDVSDAEFASYLEGAPAPDATDTPPGFAEHRAAFSRNGDYGTWLLGLPVMVKVNNTLFVHGGLPPLRQDSLGAINRAAKQQLEAGIDAGVAQPLGAPLLDDDGPLWYRGSAACHPLLEAPVLEAGLSALQAQRVVVGHTPTPTRRIQSRMNERVFVIDTGMLTSVYRGEAYLLDFTEAGVRVLDARANASEVAWWHPVLSTPPAEEAQLAESIKSGAAIPGAWKDANRATVAKLLASWRLDRELGLWMTPLTVSDERGKRYFQALRDQWISEGERRRRGRSSPNYCLGGHQNLLVAAFDALQGVTTRSVDTLFVHRANGSLRLAPITRSFGTSTQLPRYASPPTIPRAMADKMKLLDRDRVQALLGDLLSKRQITALLARRDKILAWPRTEAVQ